MLWHLRGHESIHFYKGTRDEENQQYSRFVIGITIGWENDTRSTYVCRKQKTVYCKFIKIQNHRSLL